MEVTTLLPANPLRGSAQGAVPEVTLVIITIPVVSTSDADEEVRWSLVTHPH